MKIYMCMYVVCVDIYKWLYVWLCTHTYTYTHKCVYFKERGRKKSTDYNTITKPAGAIGYQSRIHRPLSPPPKKKVTTWLSCKNTTGNKDFIVIQFISLICNLFSWRLPCKPILRWWSIRKDKNIPHFLIYNNYLNYL